MSIGHMKTSQKGIDLIRSFEGFVATPYRAVATEKYLTIGYGHYGPDVRLGMRWTKEEAEAHLKKDVERFEAHVNKYDYTYDFNQNQFDALVSFAYNIGSIDQLTNNGRRTKDQIAEKMLLYNKSGGRVLQGLVNRRKAEQALFLSGCTSKKIKLPAPTLRIRCKSDKVKDLQHFLNEVFGKDLEEDGSYGKLTKAAVMEAQEACMISMDGIYGPQSNKAFKAYAERKGYQVI